MLRTKYHTRPQEWSPCQIIPLESRTGHGVSGQPHMHVSQSFSSSRYPVHLTEVLGHQRASWRGRNRLEPCWYTANPSPSQAQRSTLHISRKALQSPGPPKERGHNRSPSGSALRAFPDKGMMRTFPQKRKSVHFISPTLSQKVPPTLHCYCCHRLSPTWKTGSTFCCFQTPVPSSKTDTYNVVK